MTPATRNRVAGRRDERGVIGMALAISVCAVLALLSIVIFQFATGDQRNALITRSEGQALDAAEGGLGAAYSALQQTTTVATLPCGSNVLAATFSTTPATSKYSDSFTYYDTYPPTDSALSCSAIAAGSVTPVAVEIFSQGTSGEWSEYMESLATISLSDSEFDQTVFSEESLNMSSKNVVVKGSSGNNASVYSNSSLACGGSSDVYGSVDAQGGFTGSGTCAVAGSIGALGDVTINGNVIGGSVSSAGSDGCGQYSSAGSVTVEGGSGLVDGSVYARCAITVSGGAKVDGSQVSSDSSLATPTAESFPTVSFSSSAWTNAGFTSQVTNNDCSQSYTDTNSVYWAIYDMDAATQNTVIQTSCPLDWTGAAASGGPAGNLLLTTVSLAKNLAIISTGGFEFQQSATFESTTSSTRQLYLIVPSSCSTSCASQYDGGAGTWSGQTVSSGVTANLNAVSEQSASSIWAVGANCTVDYYNGTSWSAQTVPTSVCPSGTSLNGVDADGGSPMVVGSGGVTFVCTASCTASAPTWSAKSTSSLGSPTLNAVSAQNPTNMWAVGPNCTVLYYNGTSWASQAPATSVCPSGTTLNGVTNNGGNPVVVGNGGLLFTCTGGGCNGGPGGPTWTKNTITGLSGSPNLLAVTYNGANNIWAVGASGTIATCTAGCNGPAATWATQTSGTSSTLDAVMAQAANTVFAAGANGAELECSATCNQAAATWSLGSLGTTSTITGVTAPSASALWGVGASGLIVEGTLSPWTSATTSCSESTSPPANTPAQPSISLQNSAALSSTADVLMYTPCDLIFNSNPSGTVAYGQFYGGAVTFTQNQTVQYAPLSPPAGATGGNPATYDTTVDIVYERQTNTTTPTVNSGSGGGGGGTVSFAGLAFTDTTLSGAATLSCSNQDTASVTCSAQPLGGTGTFSGEVELVNSSGTAVTNTGSALTVSCSETTVTSPGGTVTPASLQIATGSSATSSTFSLTGAGPPWKATMTCTVTNGGTTYTIAVTGN